MTSRHAKVPVCVYMLADHLDAALAAGEDLLRAAETWEAGDPTNPGVAGAQRWTLSRVRTHELSLLQRILVARDRAAELQKVDVLFRPMAHLFVSGTLPLAEAAHEVCDPALVAFETGESAAAYLRNRGLIAADCPGVPADCDLGLDERFLITGRLALGLTLDLVAEFLDALDIRFGLYPDGDEASAAPAEGVLDVVAAQVVEPGEDAGGTPVAAAASEDAAAGEQCQTVVASDSLCEPTEAVASIEAGEADTDRNEPEPVKEADETPNTEPVVASGEVGSQRAGAVAAELLDDADDRDEDHVSVVPVDVRTVGKSINDDAGRVAA